MSARAADKDLQHLKSQTYPDRPSPTVMDREPNISVEAESYTIIRFFLPSFAPPFLSKQVCKLFLPNINILSCSAKRKSTFLP